MAKNGDVIISEGVLSRDLAQDRTLVPVLSVQAVELLALEWRDWRLRVQRLSEGARLSRPLRVLSSSALDLMMSFFLFDETS